MNKKITASALSLIAFVLLVTASYKVQAEPTNLVARYSFEEGSGTTVADSSGYGNSGSTNGNPAWVSGKIGSSALSFDGVDDKVYFGGNNLEFGTSSFSVSAWLYNQNDVGTIIAKRQTYGLSVGWSLNKTGTWFGFLVDGGNDGGSAGVNYGAANLNKWVHVVGVTDRSSNKLNLYLDGVLVTQANISGVSNVTSGVSMAAGYWKSDTALLGSLDEVKIYNSALSASDVASLYAEGSAPQDTESPTVPSNLTASNITENSVDLSWATSTDNIGVTGYNVFKDSVLIATPVQTSYVVSGLNASTTYQFSVAARDFAGNTSASSSPAVVTTLAPVPDTTAPVISNVTASSVTSSSVNISWTTDELADTQVYYGTTTDYGSTTALNASPVTSHSQSLSSLIASTTYYYNVVSKDASGNVASSSSSFITSPAPTIGFFWSMEGPNADFSGGSVVPAYYAAVTRSTESPKDGLWSLKLTGPWPQATFNNPTNNDVWAPVTEGTVELDWQYIAPWNDRMLFQITGKCTYNKTLCAGLDTNDGIGVRTKGPDQGRFLVTSTMYNQVPVNMIDGKWYHVRYRYSKAMNKATLEFDGNLILTTPFTGVSTSTKAWHQVLIGNDRGTSSVAYIDNFRVWPTWMP